MEHLSNIELFYTLPENVRGKELNLTGDEFYHAVKVMRHRPGDELYITNGEGKIFSGAVDNINKDYLSVIVNEEFSYENKLSQITFCLPKLKNPERFEFALEKCTELGITSFIIFESERTVSKSSKTERWNKILLSAMKQSLHSYLPSITMAGSIGDIMALPGRKFVFEQNTENIFKGLPKKLKEENYFIFGPEGGLSPKELALFKDNEIYKIAGNRLRSETAVIMCASLISLLL